MKPIPLILMAILLLPVVSAGNPLTKAELFALYASRVPEATIASRLDQLFTNLPEGAFKTQARATLKQDLLDAIAGEASALTTAIQTYTDQSTATASDWSENLLGPVLEDQTNVNDTDL